MPHVYTTNAPREGQPKQFLTNQQIFDKVAKHMLDQGVQSKDAANNCLYRGPKGRKCAVGVLIPDEAYSPGFEGVSLELDTLWLTRGYGPAYEKLLTSLKEVGVNCEPGSEQLKLLVELQAEHDSDLSRGHEELGWTIRNRWLQALPQIAQRFNLSAKVVYEWCAANPEACRG